MAMQQQRAFTDSFSEFCQSMTAPWINFAQLNLETFNHLTRDSNYAENLLQARKPEEWLSAQAEYLNGASSEILNYFQKASSVFIDAASQMSQHAMQAQESLKSKKKQL